MKSIRSFLIGIVITGSLATSLYFLHAQETATPIQGNPVLLPASTVDSMSDLQVLMQAVEMMPEVPADALPRSGTFYSAQHAPGSLSPWPPLPSGFGLPAWSLGDGIYLLADQSVDFSLPLSSRMAGGGMMMEVSGGMAPPGIGDAVSGGDTNGFYSDSFNYTLPTNGLWLTLTNVSNGLAYLNLHGATDEVYEVWSKTNLLEADWNIEQELWPTDTNAMPFTIPVLDRPDVLFIWARDWTGVTSGGNTTPEWWFWKYFGTVDLADANLDSQGKYALLHDYTNGLDPNVISFTLWAGSRYVNDPLTSLQISLSGGVPFYASALVNDMNLTDAVWQPYISSNIAVNLGSTDGVYSVQAGLRGLPADAQQTWNGGIPFTLDRVAPVITITNPVEGAASVPVIQVQGYASEALSDLTFDVSNAAEIFTNQTGFVTGAIYNTNLEAFTTNYFQCYDVPLTNGLNIITLHATDLAGNMTTTNVSVTSDYSGDINPPTLTVIWPQDGTSISGGQFTFQGAVDKPGATVTAAIVDADNDTNIVQGLVEQNGTVWAQNLPLAAGANTLMLTAADAAGTNTTQLTLYQSSVTVAMNPLAGSQLNQSSVNVTGTVSDPSYDLWVNGVEAYYVDDAGGWEADNVPVSSSGTAIFDVEVYSGSGSDADVRPGLKSSLQPADAGSDSSIGSEEFALAEPVTVGIMSYRADYGWHDIFPNQQSYEYTSESSHSDSVRGMFWNYRSGGMDAGNYIYSGAITPWSDPFTNSWDVSLPAGQDNFSAPWEMESVAKGGQSGFYINLRDFAEWDDVEARVMIEPAGWQAAGITNFYLVQAQAWGFSDPDMNPWEYWPLSPDTLQIGGVTLMLATNGDGSVWGQRLIAARAGENVEVTPWSTNPTNWNY